MEFIGIHNVGLSVKSVVEVGSFFEEKLGLKVEFKLDLFPVFARVYLGNNYLFLFETTNQDISPKQEVIAHQNYPGFDHIAILCDDVDQEFEAMCERGVVFEGVPFTYPDWGVRMVDFKDPEGNWYHLFQRVMNGD